MTTINAIVLRRVVASRATLEAGALALSNRQLGFATTDGIMLLRDDYGAFHEFWGSVAIASEITAQIALTNHNTLANRTVADCHPISAITGLTSSLAGKLSGNTAITGATKTKITYDSKGLVTSGADLADTDIPSLLASKISDFSSATMFFVEAGMYPIVHVKAVATANTTLSGPQTVDGISCVAGDVVFLPVQTTTSARGVYTVNAGAWTRHPKYDSSDEIRLSVVRCDSDGTTNKKAYEFVCTNTAAISLGTTALTFAQLPNGIGTGSTQAAAGNHSHSSIATTAASSIGQALRMQYTSRTGNATTATSDLWVVYTGAGGHTETMYDGTAVSNNSGYWIRYANQSAYSWTLAPAASNTIDGSASSIVIPAGYTIDIFNVADNAWRVVGRFQNNNLDYIGAYGTNALAYPDVFMASQAQSLAPGFGFRHLGSGVYDVFLTSPSVGNLLTNASLTIEGSLTTVGDANIGGALTTMSGDSTAAKKWIIRSYTGGNYSAMYNGGVTPGNTNFVLIASATQTAINATTAAYIQIANVDKISVSSSLVRTTVPMEVGGQLTTDSTNATAAKKWILRPRTDGAAVAAIYNGGLSGGPSATNYAFSTTAIGTEVNAVTSVGINVADVPRLYINSTSIRAIGSSFSVWDAFGDTNPRASLMQNVDGFGNSGIGAGSGSGIYDCRLFRAAPNYWKTPDTLEVGSAFSLTGIEILTTQNSSISPFKAITYAGYVGTSAATLAFSSAATAVPGAIHIIIVGSSSCSSFTIGSPAADIIFNSVYRGSSWSLGSGASMPNRMFIAISDGSNWNILSH